MMTWLCGLTVNLVYIYLTILIIVICWRPCWWYLTDIVMTLIRVLCCCVVIHCYSFVMMTLTLFTYIYSLMIWTGVPFVISDLHYYSQPDTSLLLVVMMWHLIIWLLLWPIVIVITFIDIDWLLLLLTPVVVYLMLVLWYLILLLLLYSFYFVVQFDDSWHLFPFIWCDSGDCYRIQYDPLLLMYWYYLRCHIVLLLLYPRWCWRCCCYDHFICCYTFYSWWYTFSVVDTFVVLHSDISILRCWLLVTFPICW